MLQIPNHLYRILIIGGSGSGKTNALLNLMEQQEDYNYTVIYLFVPDSKETKYQHLFKNLEKVDLENLEDKNTVVEYSNDIYKIIEENNPNKEILILFDDRIVTQ